MVAKMHRLHLPKVGEGVIYVPSGMPFEADDVPPYLAGSYMRLGNKEFIYAIAGGILSPKFGAMNSYKQKVIRAGCVVDPVTGVAVVKGSMVVGVTIDVATSPAYLDGVTKDELKGGEFVGYPSAEYESFTRGIVGNTLLAANGGTLYITLDAPIPADIAAGRWCEAMRNPYGCVKHNQGQFAMVMGMPTVVATEGQGLWLQVGGPCWAAPDMEVGKLINNQEAVFIWNGSIALRSDTDPYTNADCQHAGVCIALADGEQGSMFLMLQIAH